MGTMLLLVGCTSQPVLAPVPAPAPEPPPVEAAPAPKPVTPAVPVAILVSRDIPAYTDIASRLERRLGARATRFLLGANVPAPETLTATLSGPVPGQVVAIGLEAALRARPLQQAGYAVVFCQVFNYQEHDLASGRMKGVSLLPSHQETFAVWKALAPEVRNIGVFTASGMEDMLAPAIREAGHYGITLRHVRVNSDKDFIYNYKRMSVELDGLWLLPDNRILSRAAIQDVMSYSLRNGKQVAVFNDQILKIGGLFSTTSEPDEIAMKVVQRLATARPDGGIEGPALLELQRAEVHINPVVVQRLNLVTPSSLLRHVIP